jgi:solute carrier family 25 (mitochondrial folate transporter), member 32
MAERKLSNSDLLVISTLSKVFAGVITYPYQVLRTRLQAYDAAQTYRGIADAISQIWRQEGFRGFYKGIVPNLSRVLPGTWITFLVYENTKTFLVLVPAIGDRK